MRLPSWWPLLDVQPMAKIGSLSSSFGGLCPAQLFSRAARDGRLTVSWTGSVHPTLYFGPIVRWHQDLVMNESCFSAGREA